MSENEQAPKPSLHEPPEDMMNNPVFLDAYAKEWASYVFSQRLSYMNSSSRKVEIFQAGGMETVKDASINAAKSLIILNGAAAISILAKLSTSYDLILPLLLFSWGASTGALVLAGTFVSQYCFNYEKDRSGLFFRNLSIALFFLGFALFLCGGYYTAVEFGFNGFNGFCDF